MKIRTFQINRQFSSYKSTDAWNICASVGGFDDILCDKWAQKLGIGPSALVMISQDSFAGSTKIVSKTSERQISGGGERRPIKFGKHRISDSYDALNDIIRCVGSPNKNNNYVAYVRVINL